MRPIISIVGKSKSGKTTLLESLIVELKQRGYKVAVIKHAGDNFEMDKKDKDSWRFTQAGSDVVAISSADKVAIIKQTENDLSPRELSRFIGWDYDLILTEGFKKSNALKIEVHRQTQGNELLCSAQELLAVVTDEPLDIDVPQVPGENVQELADLIEKKIKTQLEGEDVELSVNDMHIPINPFIRDLLSRILVAMVSSLKGVKEIRSLRISLRRKP
ncbi:molybdopterin-guanine dinucleotide biosynthesis protein B [Chloroflexota bacterium]